MSLGNLILSPVYRGTSFLAGPFTYLLCDGSSYSRASYKLSGFFPSSAYTAVPDPGLFYLPDLGGNGYFLRGSAFGSTECDPDFVSRTTLSGSSPTTSGVGSLQEGNFATHTHPQGSQNSANRSSFGSDGNCCYPNNVTTFNTGDAISISGPTSLGAASSSAFDLAHMKVFPYILSNF